MKCRHGCPTDVVWEDQHLQSTPDGDVWMCAEPVFAKLGHTKAPTMSYETRKAVELDQKLIGRAFMRFHDGEVTHIPAAEVIIWEDVIGAGGHVIASPYGGATVQHGWGNPGDWEKLWEEFNKHANTTCICQNGARVTCPVHGAELSEHLARTEERHAMMDTEPTADSFANVLADKLGLPNDCPWQRIVEAVDVLMADITPAYLTCPKCNTRHIDEGEFATKPHHTHACQNPECGLVWRPTIGPTCGVKTLPGFLNEPKRNPLDPGDGVVEHISTPNKDGSYTVDRYTHHKGCRGGRRCHCQPIHTTDRHYPKAVVRPSGDDGK